MAKSVKNRMKDTPELQRARFIEAAKKAEQHARFIEAAKTAEADEAPDAIDKAFRRLKITRKS
jgi:hypothetical protein